MPVRASYPFVLLRQVPAVTNYTFSTTVVQQQVLILYEVVYDSIDSLSHNINNIMNIIVSLDISCREERQDKRGLRNNIPKDIITEYKGCPSIVNDRMTPRMK